MKLRRLREGDTLDDAGVALVRGGEPGQVVLQANALQYHSIYGGYGISVFAVGGATVDKIAQQVPLVRFESLTLLRTGRHRGPGRPQPASLQRRL